MLCFPGMLVSAATQAGISVPDDPDNVDMDSFKETHTRFWIFCMTQLARPMTSPGEHWENAKVIAAIPDDQLQTINLLQLREMGFMGI